ncbi:MAG TPA: hypothetical protein VGI61_07730 [Parafilimonas sp.]
MRAAVILSIVLAGAFISSGVCNSSYSGNNINTTFPDGTLNTSKNSADIITPEIYGAIGDGKIHKLSERFSNIDDAHKVYPGAKDLDITFDGAALQKAVDVASREHKTVIAEKNYEINFPIIARDNSIIDGNNKGIIYNDRSRSNKLNHLAFFIGDHSATAFTKQADSNSYNLYDIAGSVAAGWNFVELADHNKISDFKPDQLVMIISSLKRQQNQKKTFIPFHVTMCKIVKIEGGKLFFEYPIDEQINEAQVAANGGYDKLFGINYGGVQNVVIRNLTINASQITGRAYGYKCNINNIHLIDGVRLVGINAMAHSIISNITGTFSWRCVEVKTGSSDVMIRNLKATYKPIPGYPNCVDAIAIGEYNRNITIDSFNFDFETATPKIALINLHSRKATISNGIITCKNQKAPFLSLYNEHFANDPKLGCYGNVLRNIKFYGSPYIKNVLNIGDDKKNENKNADKTNNWAYQKSQAKKETQGSDDDNISADVSGTEDVPPSGNIIDNCLFDGGSSASFANLFAGNNNTVSNCTFTKATLKVSSDFQRANAISNNNVSKGF